MTLILWILAVWIGLAFTLAALVVIAAPWLPTVPLPPEPDPDPDPQVALLDDDYDEDDDPRLRVAWNEVVEYYRGRQR